VPGGSEVVRPEAQRCGTPAVRGSATEDGRAAAARRAQLEVRRESCNDRGPSADRLGVSTPSCQGRQRWNLSDLVLVQVLPEDAWWPVRLNAPDDVVRGEDEVHTEVVDGLW
jgi:hypothetical protein